MLLMLSLASAVALAQAPTQSCNEVKRVKDLARRHGLDDSSLRALESRYCTTETKKSKAPAPPSSVFGKSAACVEAMVVEQLSGFDPAKEEGEVIKALRETLCKSKSPPSEVRYSNGKLARSSTGVWNFPSGRLARALGGPWLFPDAKTARQSDGAWSYPNGGTARYSDGSWKAPRGKAGPLDALVKECRSAGGCAGGNKPAAGAEDIFAAWLTREVWTHLGH